MISGSHRISVLRELSSKPEYAAPQAVTVHVVKGYPETTRVDEAIKINMIGLSVIYP